MKKYVIITGNFEFPERNAAAKRVMGHALALRDIGFIPVCIGITRQPHAIPPKEEYNGITGYSLPYPPGIVDWLNYREKFYEFQKIAREYEQETAAVLIYGSMAISFWMELIRKWAKRREIKTIIDCVDWFQWSGRNFLYKLVKFWDTNYQKRLVIPRADHIITVSSYLYKFYLKKHAHVHTIPPLADADKNREAVFAVCEKILHDKENTPIHICYIGKPFAVTGRPVAVSERKDRLDRSIELISYAQRKGVNLQFDIYGITQEEYLSSIPDDKRLVAELGDSIVFHGQQSSQIVINAILEADFTILNRDVNLVTSAGFPSKVTESLALGTPVITDVTSDLACYIKNAENGFLLSRDNCMDEIVKILSMSREQIVEMKQYCMKNMVLDYRNFIPVFADIFRD